MPENMFFSAQTAGVITLTCDLRAFACLSMKFTLWSSGLVQEVHVQSPDPFAFLDPSHFLLLAFLKVIQRL